MEPGPSRKRRKGGTQQRQQQALEQQSCQSELHGLLMLLLAQGLLSAVMVHRIANAAVKDIAKARDGYWVPDLEKYFGFNTGRMYRSPWTQGWQRFHPCPDQWMWTYLSKAKYLIFHPAVCYCLMLNAEGWESSVLPDPTLLPKFWETFSGHPCMQGHPIKDKPGWQTEAIPLCMHGDEVPAVGVGKIWSRSALLFSFFSMMATLAGRSSEDTNIYIWGCFEKLIIGTTEATLGTTDTFGLLLKWSFTILMEGKWPARDWQGLELLALLWELVYVGLLCLRICLCTSSCETVAAVKLIVGLGFTV